MIKRKLIETFPIEDQTEAALSLLERDCGRNFAVLRSPSALTWNALALPSLSCLKEKFSEPKRLIEMAQEDWREVLVMAETPEAFALGLAEH